MVPGKNHPEKSLPDPKPNPIPNLTLSIPLTMGSFFPGGWGFFPDTNVNKCSFRKILGEFSVAHYGTLFLKT